jgi:hypothetical protein
MNYNNPENRPDTSPTPKAIQKPFSSYSVPKQHPNKPQKPAKQQNKPQNNPKPHTTKNTPEKPL